MEAGAAGGGVCTPAAVLRMRPALQRGQLLAETGISLPQRLQTIGIALACAGTPDDSMAGTSIVPYPPTLDLQDFARIRAHLSH